MPVWRVASRGDDQAGWRRGLRLNVFLGAGMVMGSGTSEADISLRTDWPAIHRTKTLSGISGQPRAPSGRGPSRLHQTTWQAVRERLRATRNWRISVSVGSLS